MVDMKRSTSEIKEGETALTSPSEDYPWGLSLDLDKDSLEKLGIKDVAVGTVINFTAVSKVTSKHESDREDGESNRSMTLQITNMDVEGAKDSDSMAERLYKD